MRLSVGKNMSLTNYVMRRAKKRTQSLQYLKMIYHLSNLMNLAPLLMVLPLLMKATIEATKTLMLCIEFKVPLN
jgi:hypothetical protein